MFCPCPDNNACDLLFHSSHVHDYNKIDFSCTSKTYFKPKLFKCRKCKLIFSEIAKNIFENKKYVENLTDVEDKDYIQEINFKTKYFKQLFNKISSHLNANSAVLEIGLYYGVLGNIVKRHVKKYIGLELSTHACQYAKKNYNLDFISETIKSFSKNNYQFDVIIMADVIEHFDNPFETMSLIEKNLKPGGILIFTTFNMDSIFPKLMGKKYHWIMPYHLYYFSNFTLKNLCNKYNFEIFKIKNDTRLVSYNYLIYKLGLIFPSLGFIFKFLARLKFLQKSTIRVNLLDLNIYFAKKKTF